VEVPAEMIGNLLTKATETHVKILEGIPTSAVFISGYYDTAEETAYLIYFDDSFPEVELGCVIPRMRVVINRLYEATP
jgi:hypothetical protein